MNTDEYFDHYNTAPDYIDEDGNVYDETDLRESYEDALNEVYGAVTIGNSEFAPADILRELEPVTYRVGLFDHQWILGWDEWTADHEWNTTDEDEDEDEDEEECIECGHYVDYGSLCDECAAGTPR